METSKKRKIGSTQSKPLNIYIVSTVTVSVDFQRTKTVKSQLPFIPTQTPEEDENDHLQSPG